MANISVTNALNDNSPIAKNTDIGTNFTDLVNGLTDGTKDISISNGSFAGVVKAANGTVALPSLSFTNDSDCGMYRIGANNLGIAVNGVKQVDIATNGIAFPNQSGFSAKTGSAKSINNSTETTLIFDASEVYDINGEFDNTTGIFTANLAGIYIAVWTIWLNLATGWGGAEYAVASLSKNDDTSTAGSFFKGQLYYREASSGGDLPHTVGSAIIKLSASDTLRIKVYQTNGAAVNVNGRFMVSRVV